MLLVRHLMLGLLILCTSTISWSQEPVENAEDLVSCPIMLQAEPPPYGLAKAVLFSLWYANTASGHGKEMNEEIKKASNGFQQLTAMMRATKSSTNDFICAKQPLKPFAKNGNAEDVQVDATALLIDYDQHIEINNRLLDLLGKIDSMKPAELADQLSTFEVERGQRWSDLVQPTAMALMLLVDTGRPDERGGTRWLKITKAQKQFLLDWMYDHFPEFKNGTAKSQWSDPAKTAELYLTFLNGHRGSDEAKPVTHP